jgi:hypothetical protein
MRNMKISWLYQTYKQITSNCNAIDLSGIWLDSLCETNIAFLSIFVRFSGREYLAKKSSLKI